MLASGDHVKSVSFQVKSVMEQQRGEPKSNEAGVSLERAVDLLNHGDYLKANALLRRLLATDQSNIDAIHLLGISECRLGGLGNGIRILEKAARLRPDIDAFQRNLDKWRSLLAVKGPHRSEFANILQEFCEAIGDLPEDAEAWGPALRRFIAQINRGGASRMVGAAHAFATQIMFATKNFNYDPMLNGERWLLARLTPFAPRVIFDVGANRGEWSALAALYHPQAAIHAFEIVPATRQKLEAAVRDAANVMIHPFGLADHDGDVQVRHHPEFDQISSMIKNDDTPCELLEVPVRRGADVAAEFGVSEIDILKIDVEGAEMMVLSGFSSLFCAGKINVVQFEYGRTSITTKILLNEYYNFFKDHGMVFGKLFPEGVEFTDYTQLQEDFLGPNYIACRADRPDLIETLSRISGYFTPV